MSTTTTPEFQIQHWNVLIQVKDNFKKSSLLKKLNSLQIISHAQIVEL